MDRPILSEHHPRVTGRVEIEIPSRYPAARELVSTLGEKLRSAEWSEYERIRVLLAIEEALVNAIRHGNRFDRRKQVKVAYELSSAQIEIEIADEGNGFDPADVPDPTDPSRLTRPNGRGLLLMRRYMSRVDYNPSGNSVRMQVSRKASNA